MPIAALKGNAQGKQFDMILIIPRPLMFNILIAKLCFLIQVFGLTTSLKACNPCTNGYNEPGSVTVDQLVGTFSSDPSLIAFAQLCCDPSWNSRQVC